MCSCSSYCVCGSSLSWLVCISLHVSGLVRSSCWMFCWLWRYVSVTVCWPNSPVQMLVFFMFWWLILFQSFMFTGGEWLFFISSSVSSSWLACTARRALLWNVCDVVLFSICLQYDLTFCFLLPFFFAFVVLSWVVGSLYLSVSSLLLLLDMNWQQWRLTHASMSSSVTVGGVGQCLCYFIKPLRRPGGS